jgi:GrpB-like predicted nucleotidyltransferase (UPF0157 family)
VSFLHAPDPAWPERAAQETEALLAPMGGHVTVYHIGSTSVPGLPAKPIIDLLPVFAEASIQTYVQNAFEALGFEYLGEFGLQGRSYARKNDPETDARRLHADGYVDGHKDITRHLAFRDALRENASLRAAYTSVKPLAATRKAERRTANANSTGSTKQKPAL